MTIIYVISSLQNSRTMIILSIYSHFVTIPYFIQFDKFKFSVSKVNFSFIFLQQISPPPKKLHPRLYSLGPQRTIADTIHQICEKNCHIIQKLLWMMVGFFEYPHLIDTIERRWVNTSIPNGLVTKSSQILHSDKRKQCSNYFLAKGVHHTK